MKTQNKNSEKKLIKYAIVIFSILLIIQVIILVRNNSLSDTKSDKQTGERLANNSSPVFNIKCSDPILKLKDNKEDWCERECRINNMTKVKYTSKDTDIICACKDSNGKIALKKVFK